MNCLNFAYFKIAVVFIFAAIFLNGCIQSEFDSGIAKLKEMQQRYGIGEALAPGTLEKITAFKAELGQMKKETNDSEFSSALDIRINAVETGENLVLASLELQRTNPADVDCRENSPLKKAISFLEKALAKGELAEKRLESFKSSNPKGYEKIAELGLTEERMNELNKAIKAELGSANQLKNMSCA